MKGTYRARVLIVATTRMKTSICIGGVLLAPVDRRRSLRLVQENGWRAWPGESCPFAVGNVHELVLRPAPGVEPPHVEDTLVIGEVPPPLETMAGRRLVEAILDAWEDPDPGPPDRLFRSGNGSRLHWTEGGSGYIREGDPLPAASTGFWRPDRDLLLERSEQYGVYYRYSDDRRLKYVGTASPVPRIPRGTLVRVSLASWWRETGGDNPPARCYLQLSGWFPADGTGEP